MEIELVLVCLGVVVIVEFIAIIVLSSRLDTLHFYYHTHVSKYHSEGVRPQTTGRTDFEKRYL